MALVSATGVFRYSLDPQGPKLIVALGRDFGAYYRSLVPDWMPIQGTRFPPHVTVCRAGRDKDPNMAHWGKYEGQQVRFEYVPYIHVGRDYFWLEVFCDRLEEVRIELDLTPVREWTKPPGGRVRCFHTTIGNNKHVGPLPERFPCCTGRH
jgi:hypothetical protein